MTSQPGSPEHDAFAALMAGHDLPDRADLLGIERPAWMEHAFCKGEDTRRWFAPGRLAATSWPVTACSLCVVRPSCLDYALDDPELQGYWGGTTERQRRRIRKERAQDVA